ncbi:HdeD family acid-resistance protein [Sphingomonas oryzagri]
MGYGILLTATGMLALFLPIAAGFATGLFLGFVMTAGGILGIIAGVTTKGWHSRWLDIVVGTLSLLLGLAMIWNPFLGAFSLVWAIGLWLIVCGGLELTAGFDHAPHRGWLLFLGVIDILLGIYLLFVGPADALVILAVVVGLSFVFRGVFLSTFVLRFRQLAG